MSDIIYRGYTQAELDQQYDQRSLVPDISDYMKRWADGTARARASLPVRRDISYDAHPAAKLDAYGAGDGSAPIVLYFHGGAWRALDLDHSGFAAPLVVGEGGVFLAVDFALVPSEPLGEQVRQARAAVVWAYREASQFGADPKKIFTIGHSSGGHLVGTVISDGWQADAGLPPDVVKRAVACSGSHDLEPVRLSARNDFLKLSQDEARRLSPIHHIPTENAPHLSVFWGEGELDEFRRQSWAYADQWRAAGNPVVSEEVPGRNHFDISDDFADPESRVGRAIVEMLRAS